VKGRSNHVQRVLIVTLRCIVKAKSYNNLGEVNSGGELKKKGQTDEGKLSWVFNVGWLIGSQKGTPAAVASEKKSIKTTMGGP